MQVLKNLFGSDKKYYLELDESAEAAQPQAPKTDSPPAKVEAVQPQAPKADTAKVETAKEAPAKATAPKANTAKSAVSAKASAPVKAKKAQGKIKEQASAASNGKVATTPKNGGASSFDPPFWVAAMYNSNNQSDNGGTEKNYGQTFATEKLMPTVSNYRRLPGGSLKQFKQMAKTVRTSRR